MATTIQENKNSSQIPPPFNNSMNSSTQSSNYSGSVGKTSLDLEQNPFEQSFAPNSVSNKQSLATSPPLTPGGRKLPPLTISPNVPSSWNHAGLPRSGLTPNESGLRSGLTPGGTYPGALNNIAIHGINTPGSLAFNLTPSLSSLLAGKNEFDQNFQTANRSLNDDNGSNLQIAAISEPDQSKEVIKPDPESNGADNSSSSFSNDEVLTTGNESPQRQNQEIINSTGKRGRKKSIGSNSKRPSNEPLSKKPKTYLDTSSSNGKKAKPKDLSRSIADDDEEEEMESSNTSTSYNTNNSNNNSTNNNDEMTDEEKRKQFLERNRVAASKCRQRKKQQLVKMENDLNFYLNEYNNLTDSIEQLKEQALLLRQAVVHQDLIKPEIVNSIEAICHIINSTHYISRKRGDTTSTLVPTVYPINPMLLSLIHI